MIQADEDFAILPVDGRGPSVPREQTWVVDNGAMEGSIDDLHGNELAAEGQDIELGTQSLVFFHHLWQSLSSRPPAGELEHWHSILLSLQTCGTASEKLTPPCTHPHVATSAFPAK